MDTDINLKTKTVDLETLRANAEEAITYLDAKLALETQAQIEQFISSGSSDDKLAKELALLLAKLKFVRFVSLSDKELEDLIVGYLPLAYNVENLDLKDRIGKRILFIGEITDQIDFMSELVKMFERCQYKFGAQRIVSEGRNYEQTISNWLKLYLSQPAKSAVRTNIDAWSFVQKGLPAQYLAKPEREILLDILRIYDSLRNRVYLYNSLPESEDEKELFNNFDLYATLPGLTANESDPLWKDKYQSVLDPKIESDAEELLITDDETAGAPSQPVATALPQPPAAILPKLSPEVLNPSAYKPILPKVQPPVFPPPQARPLSQPVVASRPPVSLPTTRPINMDQILKSKNLEDSMTDAPGLRLGGGMPYQPPPPKPVPAVSPPVVQSPKEAPPAVKPPVNINQKLEELKRKAQGKSS